MADNQLFSRINSSPLGRSAGFPGEMTEEEILKEQTAAPSSNLVDVEKQITDIDSALNAITSTVRAQGSNPNPVLLEQMSNLKAQKTSLQDLLKERPSPAAAPEPEAGAKTMLDASMELSAPKATISELGKESAAKRPLPGEKAPTLAQGISAPAAAVEPGPKPLTLQERIAQSTEELKKEREAAGKEREEAMKRTEFGELASLVGRSLAQIGAAAQGMRTGVDLSGVGQQALVDWEKKRDRIDSTYQTKLASIAKEREQLLQQEQDAIKAENDAKLLELKQKEYGLAEKETNAKINKDNAQADLARKEAERVLLPTMTKEAREQMNTHRADWNKLDKERATVDSANLSINSNLDEAERLDAAGRGADAKFNDRAAVTAYLKQLDPVSAVLAAEYEGARNSGHLQEILNNPKFSTVPKQAKDFMFAALAGTLQPAQRTALRQAANTDYKAKTKIYDEQTSVIFNRAAQDGIPSPSLIAGPRWNMNQIDEQTRGIWTGLSEPKKPGAEPTTKAKMETPPADSSTKQPTVNLPNIKAFGSADEALKALQSRGK